MKKYFKMIIPFLLVLLLTSCPGIIPVLEEHVSYKVTYNAGNADSGYVPVDNTEYLYGDMVIVKGNLGNLTKSGSSFSGWSIYINGSAQYNQNDDLSIYDSDVILYAVWSENPVYTITYNAGSADGGQVPIDINEYYDGASVVVKGNSGNLTKSGSYFSCWSNVMKGNIQYRQGDNININGSDITLYALWSDYPIYTITYNAGSADGGQVPIDINEYYDGASVVVLGNFGNLTKSGSFFSGWSTVLNGSVLYNPNNYLYINDSDLILYAVWSEYPVYSITYNAGSADGGQVPIDINEYYDGASVVVKGNSGNLTKSGSYFSGWSAVLNGSVLYNHNDYLYINVSDLILYAVWSEYPVYTLIFNSLSADTPTTIIQSVTHPETTISLFPEDPIRTGYTFNGWAINYYTDLTTDTEISEDMEVFPNWTVNQYTVSFNSNGADSGIVPTAANFDYESSIFISGNTGNLTKAGYTFKEWNTSFDGTGYSSISGESFLVGNENTVFYAIWIVNQSISVIISIPIGEDITFSETLTVSKTETLIVSIQEEFYSYSWYLDGVLISGEENQSVSIVATDLFLGLHNLVAIVIDDNSVYSSGNCTISVTE